MKYHLLIALGILSRLLPHPPNVTPIAALGLLAGARGNSATAWAVPVVSLLVTDLWLGGYHPIILPFVYLGFAASSVIGRFWLGQRQSIGRTAAAAVGTSTVFFLLSNFGCWLAGMYPPTAGGLLECYIAALPWFGATLGGDLFYSIVLIGSYDHLMTHGSERAVHAA